MPPPVGTTTIRPIRHAKPVKEEKILTAGSPLLIDTVTELSRTTSPDARDVTFQNGLVIYHGPDEVEVVDYLVSPPQRHLQELTRTDTRVNPWRPELHASRATHSLFIRDTYAGNVLKQAVFLTPIRLLTWVAEDVLAVITDTDVYHWSLFGTGEPEVFFPRKHPRVDIVDYRVSLNLMWAALVTDNSHAANHDVELFSTAAGRSQRLQASVLMFLEDTEYDKSHIVSGSSLSLVTLSEDQDRQLNVYPLEHSGSITAPERLTNLCPLPVGANALSIHFLKTYAFIVVISKNAYVSVFRLSDGKTILNQVVPDIQDPIATWSQPGSVDICSSSGRVVTISLNDRALEHHANLVVKDVELTAQVKARLLELEQSLGTVVLYASGKGEDGQLGLGDNAHRVTPYPVNLPTETARVVQLAGGRTHSMFLDDKGRVFVAGTGNKGQLGLGEDHLSQPCTVFTPIPMSAFAGEEVRHISAGGDQSGAITVTGQLYTWGANSSGQLGHANAKDCSLPTAVPAMAGREVRAVSFGDEHTAILTSAGEVYTCGNGSYGRLGHGSLDSDRYHPTCVQKLFGQRVVSVAAGGRHTIAATDQGKVYAWGEGRDGQLGHGRNTASITPQIVQDLSSELIIQCSAGEGHSIVLTASGDVYTWGFGVKGQLGLGQTGLRGKPVNRPHKVTTLDGVHVTRVEAYGHASAAATLDGRIFTWGDGSLGRLGNGDTRAQSIPGPIASLSDWRATTLGVGTSHLLIAVAQGKNLRKLMSNVSSLASASVMSLTRAPREYIAMLKEASRVEDANVYDEDTVLPIVDLGRQGTLSLPEFQVYVCTARATQDWEIGLLYGTIFPYISRACAARHVSFHPINLALSEDDPTYLAASLAAVEKGSPNIVVLFQNDYGRYQQPVVTPSDLDPVLADQLRSAEGSHPWISGYKQCSTFEIQVRHALSYNSTAGTPAPLFFSAPDATETMPKSQQFDYNHREDVIRLRRLVEVVSACEEPPTRYTPETFVAVVKDRLMQALDLQYPSESQCDDIDFDNLCHHEYVHVLTDVYLENDDDVTAASALAFDAQARPTAILGEAGSGKSALLAHIVTLHGENEKRYHRQYAGETIPTSTVPNRDVFEEEETSAFSGGQTQSERVLQEIQRAVNPPPPPIPLPPPTLFVHFAESSMAAGSLVNALTRFLTALKDTFGLDRVISKTSGQLVDQVSAFIEDIQVPQQDGVRFVAIFDAIDVLCPDYGYTWLPSVTPSWLNIVVSATLPSSPVSVPGPEVPLNASQILLARGVDSHTLSPLTHDRRQAMLRAYLGSGAPSGLDDLVATEAAAHPVLIRASAQLIKRDDETPITVTELMRPPTPPPVVEEEEPEPEPEPEPKGKAGKKDSARDKKRGSTPSSSKKKGKKVEPDPEPEEEVPAEPEVPPPPPADSHARRVYGRILQDKAHDGLLPLLLGVVAISRRSLTLFELWQVAGGGDHSLPFARIEASIQSCPDEITRVSGVYSFFNRYIRDAVLDVFVSSDDVEIDIHNRLAAFYVSQIPEPSAYLEAGFHYSQAGNTSDLVSLLSPLRVLELFSGEEHLAEFRDLWQVGGGIRIACETYLDAIAKATGLAVQLPEVQPEAEEVEDVEPTRKKDSKGGKDKKATTPKGKKKGAPEPEPEVAEEPKVHVPTPTEILLAKASEVEHSARVGAVCKLGVLGRFAQETGAHDEAHVVLRAANDLALVDTSSESEVGAGSQDPGTPLAIQAGAHYDLGVLLVRFVGPAAFRTAEEAAEVEQNNKGKKGKGKPKTPEKGKKPTPVKGKKSSKAVVEATDDEDPPRAPTPLEEGLALLDKCVTLRRQLVGQLAEGQDGRNDLIRGIGQALYWSGYGHMFTNEHEAALSKYDESLELRIAVDGEEHTSVAQTLNTIALLHQTQEDWVKAAEIHQRVLRIRLNTLGSSHPSVAQSLASLGKVQLELGDHEAARDTLVKGIKVYEAALPQLSDKTLVAWPLLHLAQVLHAMEQNDEAVNAAERAVAIRTQHLGEEHFLTQEAIEALAAVEGKAAKKAKGDKKKKK